MNGGILVFNWQISFMFTEEEIIEFRKGTSGANHTHHFNNAGCSLPPDAVRSEIFKYLGVESTSGGYRTEGYFAKELEEFYPLAAKLVNASPEEIAFCTSASDAWRIGFNGMEFKDGDIILTDLAEYGSNYMAYLQLQKRLDIDIQIIPRDAEGRTDVEALKDMISDKVALISITHIPSNGGLINPIEAIGQVARAHKIPYLVDACQSAGQVELDVEAIGCDMLTVTGRKYLRGPRGTGFLYIRKSFFDQVEPTELNSFSASFVGINEYESRPDARRYERYEHSPALKMGLAAAIKYALDIGIDRINEHVNHLSQLLRKKLAEIPGVTVHDLGVEKCGIVTFAHETVDAGKISEILTLFNINTAVARPFSAPLDFDTRNLKDCVRPSLHYYNTVAEINVFCTKVDEIVTGKLDEKHRHHNHSH